jgi:hypothetical protein
MAKGVPHYSPLMDAQRYKCPYYHIYPNIAYAITHKISYCGAMSARITQRVYTRLKNLNKFYYAEAL